MTEQVKETEPYIVNYLTDTDFYKFSMTQMYLHKCPNERAKWKFKLRTKDVHLGYLEDACAGVTVESHNAALLTAKMCQIEVATVKDYIGEVA